MWDFKATTVFSPSTQPYCLIPFMTLRKEFIKCKAFDANGNSTDLQYHVDYDVEASIVSFSNEVTQAAYSTIRVYRQTPTEVMLTQYVDASVLKAYDMNVRDVQLLHILEEAYDCVLQYAMLFNEEAKTWNAKAGRIVNLATPADSTDATTKKYVDDADDTIMKFIRRYCMLLNETETAWDARSKFIMKVAEPENADDATTKHYVDAAIQKLDQAIRAYIAEVRAALQEAINALTERVATNEQAIERLTTRMATAEENITGIQQTLTRHAQAIAANTQGINANTEAIEAIQQTLNQINYRLEHLPSGGGGGGNVNVDELKQEILDSLMVRVEKPSLVEVRHESYGGSYEQWNAQFSYNYEAVSMNGQAWAETPGTYSVTFSLKPLYAWSDGTTEPITLEWVAVAETVVTQQIQLNSITTDGDNASLQGTHPMDNATGTLSFAFSGSAGEDWTKAPIKTFNFAMTTSYTTLQVNANGTIYSEGESFNIIGYEGSNSFERYNVAVYHDSVRVECLGHNSVSPDLLTVFVDGDSTNSMQLELNAEGWAEEPAAKIQLSAVQVNGIEYPMTMKSPYSLSLDKTASAEDWSMAANQILKFTISEPYTTLHAKINATGAVIDEGDGANVTGMYQGEAVNRYQVVVGHDNVTIIGLGYNSTVSSSFTVYVDDDEENGFVVTVTQTAHFPEIIGSADTPRLDTGTPYSYSDSATSMIYRYPRTIGFSPNDSQLAAFITNGSLTKDNLVLQGDFCVYEKRDSGDYTFTLTPAEGYVWTDGTRTPKEYTWTHERTRDTVAAPTLTLAEEHSMKGNAPALYYGGPDVVLSYDTESDGEIEVEILDNPRNAREKRYPEYTVDTVNKTISVRLTKTSRYEIEENAGRDDYGYSSFRGYASTFSRIYVSTKQSARYKASSQSSFEVYFAPGAYVDYETRTNSQAAYLNGTQMVTLSTEAAGCTIDADSKKANTVGEHTLRATLNDGVDAWWDGSTERTREFTWTLHKTCPLSIGSFFGFSSNTITPWRGYKMAGVLTLSRGNVLSPEPTFSLYQGPEGVENVITVTPIDAWGSVSQPKFAVVNNNQVAYENKKGMYIKVDFAESANTSAFTKYIFFNNKLLGNAENGYLTTNYSSHKLENGVQTMNTAAYIQHGEIPSLDSISVVVEDTSIVEIEKVSLQHWPSTDTVTTNYALALKFTPKAKGTTNVTLTIPATEHYRALVYTSAYKVN